MVRRLRQRLAKRLFVRRAPDPRSVMIAVISACGVTSKAGFMTFTPLGAICLSRRWVTSRAGRSSIGIPRRSGRRGRWSRSAPPRRTARRGAAPAPPRCRSRSCWPRRRSPPSGRRRRSRVDRAPLHEVRRHVVGDDRHRDALLLQLPGGQPGALQEGARLVGDDGDRLAGFGAARMTPRAVP